MWYKLVGALVLAPALLLVACNGGSSEDDGATPDANEDDQAAASPESSPVKLTPEAPECVEVEPVEYESSIQLEEALPEGQIAFVSFRDEYEGQSNREIYIISSDGSGPTNLTRNSCQDDEPDISADGTKIAWESDRTGSFNVFSMNSDGSDVQQLTEEGGLAPRWSPNGEMIAFTRGGSLFVMNADGSGEQVVVSGASDEAADSLCHTGGFAGGWSADGSEIIYYAASLGTNTGHVCRVAVDGSNVETLIGEPPVYNVEPVISPDGNLIAFRSIREQNSDVYVIDLRDGTLTRLTQEDGLDIEPEWSPSGEWIAFASNRDGLATDIYVMRADGSEVRRLTDHEAKDSYPVWSP